MIEEVPIVTDEPPNDSQEAAESTTTTTTTTTTEALPKKPRGRPKGSLGVKKKTAVVEKEPEPAIGGIEPVKETPKKKPAVATQKKKKPTREDDDDDDETESMASMASREHQRNQQIAAEVVQMLSNRHVRTSQAKREKYRSWFQNVYSHVY